MDSLDTSIIKTLCYADIFDFPLREDEIYDRFIANKKASAQTIKKRLSLLHQNGLIKQTGPYYYLDGRASIVKKRQAHHQNSRSKIAHATAVARKLATIPYVKAVFLTGATAVDNATRHDDLDMLIVNAKNSLWTCRFLTILKLELMGNRRRPYAKYTTNKVCLNLMLSVDNLSIPSPMRNLFTAHEVIQVKPLFDPHQYWQMFQKANVWINDYLPNHQITPIDNQENENNVEAPHWLETIMRQLQRWYMWPKRTRETVTPHAAYFHPRDTGRIVLTKLTKLVEHYT